MQETGDETPLTGPLHIYQIDDRRRWEQRLVKTVAIY